MSKKIGLTVDWIDWVMDILGEPDAGQWVKIESNSIYWAAIYKEWLEQSSRPIYWTESDPIGHATPLLFQVADFMDEKVVARVSFFTENAIMFVYGPELQRKLDIAAEWGAWEK